MEIPGKIAAKLQRFADREGWLRARGAAIGGSDIAAIAGVHPYRTPFDVYARLMGLVDEPDNQAMRIGRAMEPALVAEYSVATGRPAIHLASAMLTRQSHPYMVATVDGLSPLENDYRGLEVKTASAYQAHRWGTDTSPMLPQEYLCQVHWYRKLFEEASDGEISKWDVAALIGGSDFRVYTVQSEPELEGLLLEEAEAFWRDHVLPQRPPAVTRATQATARYIQKIYPSETAGLRPATEEEEALVTRLLEAIEIYKEAEARVDNLKAQLQMSIGDHEGVTGAFGRVTWKKVKDTVVVDWEKVASALSPPEELVKLHTTIRQGVRRLNLPRKKGEQQ